MKVINTLKILKKIIVIAIFNLQIPNHAESVNINTNKTTLLSYSGYVIGIASILYGKYKLNNLGRNSQIFCNKLLDNYDFYYLRDQKKPLISAQDFTHKLISFDKNEQIQGYSLITLGIASCLINFI